MDAICLCAVGLPAAHMLSLHATVASTRPCHTCMAPAALSRATSLVGLQVCKGAVWTARMLQHIQLMQRNSSATGLTAKPCALPAARH